MFTFVLPKGACRPWGELGWWHRAEIGRKNTSKVLVVRIYLMSVSTLSFCDLSGTLCGLTSSNRRASSIVSL